MLVILLVLPVATRKRRLKLRLLKLKDLLASEIIIDNMHLRGIILSSLRVSRSF